MSIHRQSETLMRTFYGITSLTDILYPHGIRSDRLVHHRQGIRNFTEEKVQRYPGLYTYTSISMVGTALNKEVLMDIVLKDEPVKPFLIIVLMSVAIQSPNPHRPNLGQYLKL